MMNVAERLVADVIQNREEVTWFICLALFTVPKLGSVSRKPNNVVSATTRPIYQFNYDNETKQKQKR